jgi:molybdenum cofactor cytidylyltransferase
MIRKVSAILLAAGLSARMGADKLLLDYNGKSFFQHSVDLLQELPVYELIIVTTDVRYKQVIIPPDIKVCINPHPEQGQSSSIRAGVEAATGTHYLFLVADQPLLASKDIQPLLDASVDNPEKIIFPIIDSNPTSPTLFPGSFREKLQKLCGDKGGRVLRDANKEVWHPVYPENPERFIDIDCKLDYIKL